MEATIKYTEELNEDFSEGINTTTCVDEWDSVNYVYWDSTEPDQMQIVDCHYTPGENISRYCDDNGEWAIPVSNCNDDIYLAKVQFYLTVVQRYRIQMVIGYFLSWTSLLVALIIFLSFRSLNCNRTKIHKHYFAAFLLRLTMDLINGIDRLVYSIQDNNRFINGQVTFLNRSTLDETAIVCDILNIGQQYGYMCAIAWMFIEGLYLNTLISRAVFGRPNFLLYYFIGWGCPAFFIASWATTMYITLEDSCWGSFSDSPFYRGLIEVPRNILLLINVIFLVHIVYVLVTKLRESNSGETQLIRKAVKALMVLVPLLGIANLTWILSEPTEESSPILIVIFYHGISFIDAFQGFLAAIFFCFVNREVRMSIKRKWSTWINFKPSLRRPSVITSTSDVSTRSNSRLARPGSATFESLSFQI